MNEIINVPVPEAVENLRLVLQFGAGELILSPGSSDVLLSGEIQYADDEFKPVFDTKGGVVTLSTGIGDDIIADIRALWQTREKFENVWNLEIGTVPLDLLLRIGAAKSSIDLGDLSLRDLTIEQGATDLAIDFSKPNRAAMRQLMFTGGASRSVLRGLGNTRAEKLYFRGGAGDFQLDFSGASPVGTAVTVDAGMGRVLISIPESVPAILIRKGALTTVSGYGAWHQTGNLWYNGSAAESAGPDEADGAAGFPGIRFTVTMGLGALELRNV